MKKTNYTLGILGGMGTYATINIFNQYAEVFSARKEWERPRIIIDNRCTMPSRVRAVIYDENVDLLVNQMIDSLENLVKMGGDTTKIILACNTSHVFLPYIYDKRPELKRNIVNILDNCVNKIINDNKKDVYVLASEGTIKSGVYSNKFKEKGVNCKYPDEQEIHLLRKCIEAVKQNEYSGDIIKVFINLVEKYDNCILGCTELPILYSLCRNEVSTVVYDPIMITLQNLKKEFDSYE